jgi:RNA polymerase sigma-70 factor (ECF subfamily)
MELALDYQCNSRELKALPETNDNQHAQDARLVQQCLAGEDDAFAELISLYQSMVFNLSYRMTSNWHEAEDLTQEVFLKVSRSLQSFRGHSALKTWIYRITVNMALNRIKYHKRRKANSHASLHARRTESSPSLEERLPDHTPSPDRMVGSVQINQRLQQALGKLVHDQRTVVILRDVQGLTYEEIAGALEIRIGTVKSRLARGRAALQTMLKDLL